MMFSSIVATLVMVLVLMSNAADALRCSNREFRGLTRSALRASQLGQTNDAKGLTSVPSGQPILFSFEVVSPMDGIDWGEVEGVFDATPGYRLYTTVGTFPLGIDIEEKDDGDSVQITAVDEDGGGAACGLLPGDVLRAFTSVVVPPRANLVKEKVGALYTCDWRNPRLFDQTLDALGSNSPSNGGPGKSIIVIERKKL